MTDGRAMAQRALRPVEKRVLDNGLTVLVRQTTTIPKVYTQLWYGVGSKDEQTGQKGLAHLLEHMIFKGTKRLSESDINVITHKLSGSCNAFTSYDYTGYLFDFPTRHWHYALDMLADCMRNCTLREDFLHSELKAVIQELKMGRDNYIGSLAEAMVTSMFPDHPYHYPIIGYKQDLWSVNHQDLVAFYQYYYVPNNATLVVVGDIAATDAFKAAEQYFGALQPNPQFKRQQLYHNQDLSGSAVTLHREIAQPCLMLGFKMPGIASKNCHQIDLLAWLLGNGKGSRLYNILVNQRQLATNIEVFSYDLFEYTVLFIWVEPKNTASIDAIVDCIMQELASCAQQGFTEKELQRALKKTENAYWSLLESNSKQAYKLGELFAATQDEQYLLNYLSYDKNTLPEQLRLLVQDYMRPSVMCLGKVVPLEQSERAYWLAAQQRSDQEDARILQGRMRETVVEPAVVAPTIQPSPVRPFAYPHYTQTVLANGMELLTYHNANVPKIEIIVELAAKSYTDPLDQQGISLFVSSLLSEGTTRYDAQALAQLLGSYGMSFSAAPGYISLSMLSADFKEGLQLLYHIITEALLAPDAIELVREKLLADIRSYWDEPYEFVSSLVKEHVYSHHPYGKSAIGSLESIKRITQAQLRDWYKQIITPRGARMAIVGDIQAHDVQRIVADVFGSWKGETAPHVSFPVLTAPQPRIIEYPIARDQIVLCFVDLSVNRRHPDYDALLLFDQIFGGGVLGSMSSKLFDLREQTGLFYTVRGSLIAGAEEEPGVVMIKTIVSRDRLHEAETAIKDMASKVVDTLTPDELMQAKNALVSSLVNNFETNRQIASSFLFLRRYDLPINYFDTRAEQLNKITLEQVKAAAQRVLKPECFSVVRIGRIDEKVVL